MELSKLEYQRGMSRRQVLSWGAMAVMGEVPGYVATPEKGRRWPLVVVVHDVWGVDEPVREVCDRLAKEGWMAVAPDLFGRLGKLEDVMGMAGRLGKVSEGQALGDLEAAVGYARGTGRWDGKRFGMTGFGWGGTMVWRYAARSESLRAGVVWYGPAVGTVKTPMLGLYGGRDRGIPAERRGGEVVVYPEADHEFVDRRRRMYDEAAARDGWAKMLAWFRKHKAG